MGNRKWGVEYAVDSWLACSRHDMSGIAKCTKEEAVDKLRKALSKSKGACNTRIGLELAILKDSTVDDIIRLGCHCNEKGEPTAPKKGDCIAIEHGGGFIFKRSAWARRQKQQEKRVAKLGDTVYGRFLKEKGLWKSVEEKGLDRYATEQLLHNGGYVMEKRALQSLMFTAKLDLPRFKKTAPNVLHSLLNDVNLTGNDEKSQSKREMLLEELNALEQADENVLSYLNANYESDGWKKERPFAAAFWALFKYGDKVLYTAELGRMFMEALKYMGIGIYHDNSGGYNNLPSRLAKGTIPLAKKAVALQSIFNKMLKQGHDPKIVRDEMVSQLTNFGCTQCGLKWKFFARLDAPLNYEVAKKPSAKKTAQATTKGKKETRTEVVNGMTLRF